VTGAAFTSWGVKGGSGYVSFSVDASGTGPITIAVTYSAGDQSTTHTFQREGATQYVIEDSASLDVSCEATWTFQGTASPGGATDLERARDQCQTPGATELR
jgi:hypothetical protein